MRRAFLALCLAALSIGGTGCCTCCQQQQAQLQQAPWWKPWAPCSSGGLGCTSNGGCTGSYWGDWFQAQAPCCNPCDKCGNWRGRGYGDPGLASGAMYDGQVPDGAMVPGSYQEVGDTIVNEPPAPPQAPVPAPSPVPNAGARSRRPMTAR